MTQTPAAKDHALFASSGPLEVRLAATQAEIEAVQRLRYQVFYEEMSAKPSPEMAKARRDFDRFDEFCDHLLVRDTGVLEEGRPKIVGTYRFLRREVAEKHGGFYTAGEYDIAPMLARSPHGRFLELGRSCVLEAYRTGPAMQIMWRGLMVYVARHKIELMFGCASLPKTEPELLTLELSYLYHFHLAPEDERVRALPHLYVPMNLRPKEKIDEQEGFRALPPLVRAYVRAGGYVGDGAVVDKQFGTTDVFIYFPVSRIDPRWRARFTR